MYKPHKGGSSVDIQGLECHLPPVGKVFNRFTNNLESRQIYKRSEKAEQQYWEIPKKPEDVSRALILEDRHRKESAGFFDVELQQYREQEWDRRMNGFWFYNNGKPTYITGLHYFYLSHWVIDIGYPSFRIPDLKWFYFWEYCVEDPDCFGMNEVTQRRQGKCHSTHDLIRMFNGDVKKAGEIKSGDLLMGPDSSPRRVLETYGGFDDLYKVNPNKGDGYECTGDHLIHFFYNSSYKCTRTGWLPKSYVNIKAKDYNDLTQSEKDHLVQERVAWGDSFEREVARAGVTVEKSRFGEYAGFHVDGDHLYLLADGTVCHNSFRAGVMVYEATSRTKRKRSGIQSKDKESAETFFDVHVVQPFTELEQLFKPTIDLDKGMAPKSVLRFFKQSAKGVSSIRKQEDEGSKELKSRVDYQSSKNKAYDGKKLLRYIRDEAGKVDEQGANVYVAHGIVKPCLTDGDLIIGKALYTTTVEDMRDDDNPDGNFKLLWDESDQSNRGSNGRTKSGLYRYFMAAYECMYFDKYGFADEAKARLFHQSERDNLAGQSLADYIRKYPFSADEAFWTSREGGIFNPMPIENQRKELGYVNPEDLYVIGNLHWEGGRFGTKAIFTETPYGKFKFHKKFDIRAECEKANSTRNIYGKLSPTMKATRIIGVDPVDHKLTEQAGSRASAHLYIKYNLGNELSETFVCEYLNRPEDPEIFYSDMAILAFATGAPMMVENQKPGLINYCNRLDFENFIINFGTTQGIPASPKNQRLLADVYEIYIEHNIKKIIYPNILSDLSVFNLIKTTKFDAAMSSGWALVGSYDERVVGMSQVEKPKAKTYSISDFY
jgi:hypothetical protein